MPFEGALDLEKLSLQPLEASGKGGSVGANLGLLGVQKKK